ncbi:MAG: nitroreductase/quinone reductase family protein [Candidatus Binatia bacterium]|nr:nitroreductase/quinone reductase family protein [Candidatus Binatia bacterium]
MDDRIVKVSTSPAFTWWIRNVAARLDPVLFKATNGRLTTFGPPTMPMVTLTTLGRRSGRPHSVHLASVEHAGDLHVVASAMGQKKHPAWRYNIEANPEVRVQAVGERFTARAEALTDQEKDRIWDDVKQAIPQMVIYETRTERNIRVYRLRRLES